MQYRRRWTHSQNFLHDRELVSKLVRGSSLAPSDSVLEIGPGRGIITHELLKIAGHVTAIEIDPSLRIPSRPKLTLIHQDFLQFTLPQKPYKVFSNIPFNITGEIIKKLFLSPNPPTDSYLVIQNEAAAKFTTSPHHNSMLAILFYPLFSLKIIHHFSPTDFHPRPQIRSCLLRIHKLKTPLIPIPLIPKYRDFIVWNFVHNPLAKFTPPQVWIKLFAKRRESYPGSYSTWLSSERQLQKIHRTRIDKSWKRFRS